MPLFSRSSFRTPKKPPRRKADSVPNISTLGLEDTLNFTADSARVEGGSAPAVAMKLGGYDVSFEDGQWLVTGGGEGSGPSTREHIRLQKQNVKLLEENNLLKYKVELLLDMLAASSADCLVLQKELEAVKKAPAAKHAGKR